MIANFTILNFNTISLSDINKLFIINSRTCYQDKKINKYSHITLS